MGSGVWCGGLVVYRLSSRYGAGADATRLLPNTPFAIQPYGTEARRRMAACSLRPGDEERGSLRRESDDDGATRRKKGLREISREIERKRGELERTCQIWASVRDSRTRRALGVPRRVSAASCAPHPPAREHSEGPAVSVISCYVWHMQVYVCSK